MKNRKGFTLIELLAVIIILGILMIIAVPSVTSYITDSRKEAYISTAKEVIGSTRNLVNGGELKMYEADTTYYIPASLIPTENSFKSPYGDFTEVYVGVTYNGKSYGYYWISNDETGTGIDEVVSNKKLEADLIKPDIQDDEINNSVHRTGIGNRKKIKILKADGTWEEYDNPTQYVVEDDIYNEEYMCDGCKYLRPSSYITRGRALTQSYVTSYTQLADYKTKPFIGVKLEDDNIIKDIQICFFNEDKLACLGTEDIYLNDGYLYFTYVLANLHDSEYWIQYQDFIQMDYACTSLYYTQHNTIDGPIINQGRLYTCVNDKNNSTIEFLENEGFRYYQTDTNYKCIIYSFGKYARCY